MTVHARIRDRWSARRWTAILSGVALVLGMGAASWPAAGAPGGDVESHDASSGVAVVDDAAAGAAGGEVHSITLITGDVVTLYRGSDGRQAVSVENVGGPNAPDPLIHEVDGQVHVIPAEAEPYLASGALDPRLFDVSLLVEFGYDDATRPDLPLLVSASGPTTAAATDGVTTTASLDALDASAVTVDKDQMRSVWEAYRGAPAPMAATEADLRGADRIWLNGKVEATLDRSVPHIGAPAAWEAGFDGDGVRVAVLDSGYDPEHPDLGGVVEEAADFTDSDGESSPVDGNGHGTHVAATVAGSGAASDGLRRGVAPGADLLIGKVLDDGGSGYEDWIIAGMEWAASSGADIVSMSLGGLAASDGSDPMSQALNRITEETGTLFVVAAGNTGPGFTTVTSPGAADRALTVGASTVADEPASFSARGPRLGDGAVKPDVVAPGVDIVAARAAGTSLGGVIDEYYTSLNGTSMATPHVAGAAALLAQQHPDWDADELKARLSSTAVQLDESVWFQGAGRIDVAAAIEPTVTVDQGNLSIGRLAEDGEDVVRTLTYHNPTDRRVVLRVTPDVHHAGGGNVKPVRISRPVVTIPAGGSASVTVHISPQSLDGGEYTGYINGQDVRQREPVVSTVTAFSVERPVRTVTVEALDRAGNPAHGRVELWDHATGDVSYVHLWEGSTGQVQVPEGEYTAVAVLETPGPDFRPLDQTIAGDPNLEITGDVVLEYDARDGEPMDLVTPRAADTDIVTVSWRRRVGDHSMMSIPLTARTGEDVYTIPGSSATEGTFDVAFVWQAMEPLLQLTADGSPIAPNPRLATGGVSYVGEGTLPVVDVGLGTPEEFAAVDVGGAVALVERDPSRWVGDQVQAASSAGAEFVLVTNTTPGPWLEEAWFMPLPGYVLDLEAGTALRAALAGMDQPTLDVTGIADSRYMYLPSHLSEGRVPEGRVVDVADLPMATVTSDYRQDSERMGRHEAYVPYLGGSLFGKAISALRNGPVVRTEYVSAGGAQWQRYGRAHGEFVNMYWVWSRLHEYATGEQSDQLWWGPLTRPAVPPSTGVAELGSPVARFRDTIRVSIPHFVFGSIDDALSGTIYQQMGDQSRLSLHRDGELVGEAAWPEAQFTVPADSASYELRLDVVNGSGHWADTSVATDTVWKFQSARPDSDRAVLPLIQADYDIETGSYNEVAAGSSPELVVTPSYQPEATGPSEFTVAVEVTYDDGATWVDAPVTAADGRFVAAVPASTGAGFAGVRVTVTDSDGTSLTQRIDRAWKIMDS